MTAWHTLAVSLLLASCITVWDADFNFDCLLRTNFSSSRATRSIYSLFPKRGIVGMGTFRKYPSL
jgi:hypothetical protein